jgi:hypothetical protein
MKLPGVSQGVRDTAFPRRRGARGGWANLSAFMPDWETPSYTPDDSNLAQTADLYSIGSQILNVFNTAQIRQINIDRAKQGLPPIDSSAIAPQVNVGLSPEISSILKWGMLAGVGYIALQALRK